MQFVTLEHPGGPDVGPAVVDYLRRRLQIDQEWLVQEQRSFEWWAHRLRQRVWAEPVRSSGGHDVVRVQAECDLLRGVQDRDAAVELANELNADAGLDALVFVPERAEVVSRLSCVMHENVLWLAQLLAIAVAHQVGLAESRADQLAAILGGEVATSSHPESGRRPEPDEMLNIVPSLAAEAVDVPLGRADYEDVAEQLRQVVLASPGDTGFTAEVPFWGATPAVAAMALDQPGPETALVTVSEDEVLPRNALGAAARLGSGLVVRLRLPVDASDLGELEAGNRLNRSQTEDWSPAHLMGAWHVENETVAFASFVPGYLLAAIPSSSRPGLLVNVTLWMGALAGWARAVLTDTPAGEDATDEGMPAVLEQELYAMMSEPDAGGRRRRAADLAESAAHLLGADHAITLGARAVVGSTYLDVGENATGLPLLQDALPGIERALGGGHPFTLFVKGNLGLALVRTGRARDAIPMLEQVRSGGRLDEAPRAQWLMFERHLAYAYYVSGRKPEARTLAKRVMAEYEDHFGKGHPETENARRTLAFRHSILRRVFGFD